MLVRRRFLDMNKYYLLSLSKKSLCLLLVYFLCSGAWQAVAQSPQDSTQLQHIFQLNVEDIFSNKETNKQEANTIASVTGKSENTFEVPVGASVITQRDISNAGCLNLAEALRLLPGVLVRETTAGNYDINIRGFNNLPPSTDFVAQDNSNTLVMIDNRPIFNYFSGGTFWETLPIDIQDIERIELIRGAVAALYGPNSVTGVINIITRRPQKEGAYTQAELQYGSQNTQIVRGSFGMFINDRAKLWASANFQQRDRTQEDYYALLQQQYTNNFEDLINYQTGQTLTRAEFLTAYPNLGLSQRKLGINLFGDFVPLKKLKTEVAIGIENSQALRPFAENTYTPISTMRSQSWYANINNYYGNAHLQVAYLRGEQEPGVRVLGSHYDFNVLDVIADYSIKTEKLLIKPSISYRRAIYDDTPYFANLGSEFATGLLNARTMLDDLAAALQADWNVGKFRLVGAARLDKYNVPDATYFSYLGAINYQPSKNHFLRLSYAKANQSPFFVNVLANYETQLIPTPDPNLLLKVEILGNEQINLLENKSLEFAYRSKIGKGWQTELEFFYTTSNDFSKIVQSNELITGAPLIFNSIFRRSNIEMTAEQLGLTFSAEYSFEKGKFNLFGTVQQTNLQNFSPFNLSPESDPSGEENTSIQSDVENYAATPTFYGGFSGFITIGSRFQVAANGYVFTRHELTHISDEILDRPIAPFEVKTKFLLNAKLTYLPVQQLKLFLNLRNILLQDSQEYYFTDRIGSMVLLGINFEL